MFPVRDLYPYPEVAPSCLLCVSFCSVSEVCWTELNSCTLALWDLPYQDTVVTPGFVSWACQGTVIYPILLDWNKRHLWAVCTPGQHEQQIFWVLLLKTWAWPAATHGDDMVFRISYLECVLSHFSLRTNIRLAEFLPGLACTHQLTAAPPGPSGAPEPCPTCWHPKSALGEHPQGLLYTLNCAKMFLCLSPTPGHARTQANAKRGTVPKVFSCGPTASLVWDL